MDNQFAGFLKEQIEKNTKSLRNTWIIGSILVVVVIGYMSVLLWVVKGFLDPWTAAQAISSVAEKNLPHLLVGVENSLKEQASVIANTMSQKALESLPLIRQEAEKQIAAINQDVLPNLAMELSKTLSASLREHKQEILEFVKTHQEQELVAYFLDSVGNNLLESLDKTMQSDTPGQGINYLQVAVVTGLSQTKQKILNLSSKDPSQLTRIEALQRKLLVLLINAVDKVRSQQLAAAQ